MSHASDPRFAVRHALRLKGFADIDAIAEQTGLYPSQVRNFLEHLLTTLGLERSRVDAS